jgi:hypothetical protein
LFRHRPDAQHRCRRRRRFGRREALPPDRWLPYIPCAHQADIPWAQAAAHEPVPTGSPQQRHKLEPVERWKGKRSSSCGFQPGAAGHLRAQNVEDIG